MKKELNINQIEDKTGLIYYIIINQIINNKEYNFKFSDKTLIMKIIEKTIIHFYNNSKLGKKKLSTRNSTRILIIHWCSVIKNKGLGKFIQWVDFKV